MIDTVVFDVDGVFTDGGFYYSAEGKVFKRFGAHDSDGIKLLRKLGIKIFSISADKRGFDITKRRMDDLKIPLTYVSEESRFQYIKNNFDRKSTGFVGDGMHDAAVLSYVEFGLAPANACFLAKQSAQFVTESEGGAGAVFEAALEIARRYYPDELQAYQEELGAYEARI